MNNKRKMKKKIKADLKIVPRRNLCKDFGLDLL
jgi:hypothetical protein